ncbi:unnamed protein product [Rotaria sordida]|uniref:Uncharacterized protein n=1 Tax=Rotaria sordida TaxID=392033 RepID=A0A815G5U7_9BILA|nr:unnamed protein product [Rotaria sordida]
MALWSIILAMHLFSFEEAQELIDEYEYYHLSVSFVYLALLSDTRNINNDYLLENVYNHMKKLFPEMTNPLISAAVLLANSYKL